jgi:hypothetical protein
MFLFNCSFPLLSKETTIETQRHSSISSFSQQLSSRQRERRDKKKKKLHKGLSTEMSLQLAALEQEEQAPQPVSEIL